MTNTNEGAYMSEREWVIEDPTPEDMAALDCSSAPSLIEGLADPENEPKEGEV